MKDNSLAFEKSLYLILEMDPEQIRAKLKEAEDKLTNGQRPKFSTGTISIGLDPDYADRYSNPLARDVFNRLEDENED